MIPALLCSVVSLAFLGLVSGLNTWQIPENEPWRQVTPELDDQWNRFKKVYNRTHEGKEEIHRRLFWEDNTRFILQHNAAYVRGEHSYTVAENDFADMAWDEFQKIYLDKVIVPDDEVYPEPDPESDLKAPASWDWVARGLVGPVKNQGQCGSCWAFSACAALEGQTMKMNMKSDMLDCSEQDLVDCARGGKYPNYACQGGWMNYAFAYIRDNGVDGERCYGYTGRAGWCRHGQCRVMARDKGSRNVAKSENSLKQSLYEVGPIAVAVDVTSRAFMFYRSGVYNNPSCRPNNPTHAMTNVGYGVSGAYEFWKIKNSWGANWGDQGYIKMARNRGNQCGIANFASYPVVTK